MIVKIGARHYYDLNPTRAHRPGDIWSDLPTLGALRQIRLPGIVITPACDLTNRKVTTITYLPLLSVTEFVVSSEYLSDLWLAIRGQLAYVHLDSLLTGSLTSSTPSLTEVGALSSKISELLHAQDLSSKERGALERTGAGLRLCGDYCRGAVRKDTMRDYFNLFGDKGASTNLSRLVRNSHSSDVHFLPHDDQPTAWSGVKQHSVVLFRYPITVPFEILDRAQDVAETVWNEEIARLADFYPCAATFADQRPMKRVTLKIPFISDLLTRYMSMYGRLGSPDFTHETIDGFLRSIRNGE